MPVFLAMGKIIICTFLIFVNRVKLSQLKIFILYLNKINENMFVFKKKNINIGKNFCCACYYDIYIIQMNEKKPLYRHFRNDLFHQLCPTYRQKKIIFVYKHRNFIMLLRLYSLNFIVSPSIVNKDKANKILDNTCNRTIYLGLRSNCVI